MNKTSPDYQPKIATLALAAAISPLAINIYLPSLPSITGYFQTTPSYAQLSISMYLATTALLQLIFGPLSDKYGRRPVMISLLFIMLLATLVCIYAPTIEVFLLGRVMQASAAVGVVLSRAIVRDMVEGDEAASMIGYVTMGMTLAPMLGPAIGGLLEERFGWQASFWLLFGFTCFSIIIMWFNLHETNNQRGGTFKQQFQAWPELVGSKRFWGYAICCAFSSGSFFAFLGGGPLLAASYYNTGPTAFGLYFMLVAVGYMLGNFLAGQFSPRVGVNRMIMGGNVLVLAGMVLALVLTSALPEEPMAFFMPVFFIGLGNGITLPNANAGIVNVRPAIAGAASGLGASVQIGGGAAFATLTAYGISYEDGPASLIGFIITSIVCAIVSALYVMHIERLRNQI